MNILITTKAQALDYAKARTASFKAAYVPPAEESDMVKGIRKAVSEARFGCQTGSVQKLMSFLVKGIEHVDVDFSKVPPAFKYLPKFTVIVVSEVAPAKGDEPRPFAVGDKLMVARVNDKYDTVRVVKNNGLIASEAFKGKFTLATNAEVEEFFSTIPEEGLDWMRVVEF